MHHLRRAVLWHLCGGRAATDVPAVQVMGLFIDYSLKPGFHHLKGQPLAQPSPARAVGAARPHHGTRAPPRAPSQRIAAHAPHRAAPRRAAPHRTALHRAASHLGAQHRTAAQPPRTAAHRAASQTSSAASAAVCAALGGGAGGHRSELRGQTHGAQANMRRDNLQHAKRAQPAAQVGCHSHRRRGQASTRAHCSAGTLLLIFGRLLFFDLRCKLTVETNRTEKREKE